MELVMSDITLYEIKEHPGYYATKDGFVYYRKKSGTFNVLANKGYKGYLSVSFNDGTREYIHRIIAKMFIENPENKPEVDHIDTDVTNNCCENLRWVTRKENSNNKITIEHYKKSNQKKAMDRFVYSPDVIPFELKPMETVNEMIQNLEIGAIYRVSYDIIPISSLRSACNNLRRKGMLFRTLNYPLTRCALVKRIK